MPRCVGLKRGATSEGRWDGAENRRHAQHRHAKSPKRVRGVPATDRAAKLGELHGTLRAAARWLRTLSPRGADERVIRDILNELEATGAALRRIWQPSARPPPPMSLRSVIQQLPPRPPVWRDDDDDDDKLRDEERIRRHFGPAAHLLTVGLAARLAPHLPLTCICLVGQAWTDVALTEPAERGSVLETMVLLGYYRDLADEDVRLDDQFSDDDFVVETDEGRLRFGLYQGTHGTLCSGSGCDPVYIFLPRRTATG